MKLKENLMVDYFYFHFHFQLFFSFVGFAPRTKVSPARKQFALQLSGELFYDQHKNKSNYDISAIHFHARCDGEFSHYWNEKTFKTIKSTWREKR